MSNKLIFCFDGTSNEPADSNDFTEDTSISNILKLHIFLGGNLKNEPNSKTPNQRSFYYSGVGTRGNWLQKILNSMFAPASFDISDILEEAKDDLNRHYKNGDEVYIFGFSRGAAIARIFASKCTQEIQFIGVFDTVAAIKGKGLDLNPETYPSSGVLFENGTMDKRIKKAVHLVSIDEKRLAFQPTLINKREGVEEIWFAGVHSDIGGGYWFDALSDITLDFMINKINNLGENNSLQILDIWEINFTNFKEKEYYICRDDIVIKHFCTGILHKQNRSKIISKNTLAPRVVRVNVDDKASKLPPVIHYTVIDRFNKIVDYRPYALRNTKYKVMDSKGNVEEQVRNGIEGLDKDWRLLKKKS